MGLPVLSIIFKKLAETAVKRSGNGAVALILSDNTKEETTYIYKNETDIVKSHWTAGNLDYLNLAFKGNPKSVIVERVKSDSDYEETKARLAHKNWDYLAIPSLAAEDVKDISDWIIAQRRAKKGFKAVLPHSVSNDKGIINFDTENCKTETKTYSAAEYCVRIASLLAGTSLDESATGKVIPELISIDESLDPDSDVDSGKFILINDGEQIEVARAINSLTTPSGDDTEDMKSIKIVEGMDLISADIRKTYKENYVGKSNSLENKEKFIAASNQYFTELVKEGVLYDGYEHTADIDVDAQRAYLAQKKDVSGLTDAEIRKENTGRQMFMKANIQLQDAAEDLNYTIYI